MSPAAILAALALGMAHAPAQPVGCAYTVPVLAVDYKTSILSGNMRTTDGGCIVWLNLPQAGWFNRCWLAQLGAHEAGHLGGLQHSLNPNDVMYSPFKPLRLSWCKPKRR